MLKSLTDAEQMAKGRAIRLAQKYSPRQYIGYSVGKYYRSNLYT
jgi:hypothetical protein